MDALPPESDPYRRQREHWEEFRAWCAWQERVEFVRANGSRWRGVSVVGTLSSRVHVTPPPSYNRVGAV